MIKALVSFFVQKYRKGKQWREREAAVNAVIEDAPKSYNWYIKRDILFRNSFDIKEIHRLEELKSLFFHRKQYHTIEEMILLAKDLDTIRALSVDNEPCDEDITIITFVDQQDRRWIAVMYDSNELWQNPEAIGIFPAAF